MLLRLARHSDLPALMPMVHRIVPLMRADGNLQWDNGYPNEQLFERDIDQSELWVAELAVAQEFPAALAGVAAITTDQSPEYTQVGWDVNEPAIVLHRLAVDPEYRGQGIATALLRQAET